MKMQAVRGGRDPLLNSLVMACLLAMASLAQAQTAPDAGSLLRDSRQQPPQIPQLPKITEPKLLSDSGIKVTVRRFEVSGSTRFDNAQLAARLADLVGQDLGFAQLQAAADRLAALYRDNGLHATALLPEQTLTDGLVRIVIVEGRFGELKMDNATPVTRRQPTALLQRMLEAGQTAGEVIDTRALERAALIANELPGLRVSTILASGARPGESDVIAKVDERPLLAGAVTLDNHDARASGSTRLGVTATLGNPFGFGDDFQGGASANEGKAYLRAAYGLPLGASGLRVAVNASAMRYKLVGEFESSGGKGSANTAGAVVSYPLLRSVAANLSTTATVDHQQLKSDSIAGRLSDKLVDTLTLGVNGDSTDALGGGGALLAGVQVSSGRLDLAGNAADLAADQAGSARNGRFMKLNANIGRLQRLTDSGNLWFSVSGQYADKNLDSSQKLSLGGASGVRAYPSLEGSGDHGWLATVEYRHHLNDAVQFTAFYDHGQVTREHAPLATAARPNTFALKGAGVGMEWQIAQFASVRAVVANRIGSNPAAGPGGNDSDGTKRRPQVWLSASLAF